MSLGNPTFRAPSRSAMSPVSSWSSSRRSVTRPYRHTRSSDTYWAVATAATLRRRTPKVAPTARAVRWKPALNTFALNFADRMSAVENTESETTLNLIERLSLSRLDPVSAQARTELECEPVSHPERPRAGRGPAAGAAGQQRRGQDQSSRSSSAVQSAAAGTLRRSRPPRSRRQTARPSGRSGPRPQWAE